jgi:ADP-ribose pyrophosphatase YjhB (NUDIX family)
VAIPDYLRKLRSQIGHDAVFMGGVIVVVINDAGEILLQRRSDNGLWGLPGGIMDPGEEPGPAAAREVTEETGIESIPERIIAVYGGADCLVPYPNGDLVQFVDFIMACRPVGGLLAVSDDESLEVGYFGVDQLSALARNDRSHIVRALKNEARTHFRLDAERGKPLMSISDYIRNLRAKIGHDLLLVPGVSGVVINDEGEILLHRRSDNGKWSLPGGAMDPGEEPADALVREIREETGVEVLPERIVGVSSGPDHRITYGNGDEVMILSICFACRPVGGAPQINDDESLEVRYFPLDALPPLEPRHQFRIEQALRNDSRTHFRMNSTQEIDSK